MNTAWAEQLQSANWSQAAACALGSYALGCICAGYYLVRAATGGDIRQSGSGSVGARNVGRVLGKSGFVLTALGDFAKGALAAWLSLRLTGSERMAALAMVCVVIGHNWPAQLRFHGGKGVATSLGALLIYDWRLAVTFGAVFLAGASLMRRAVLPSLFAYICLPLAGYWAEHDGVKASFVASLALVILLAHRKNVFEEIPTLGARDGDPRNPEESKL